MRLLRRLASGGVSTWDLGYESEARQKLMASRAEMH